MAGEIECKYLDLELIENICDRLAKNLFDSEDYPLKEFKYVNKGLMESAINSAKMPYYETLFQKAGTLGFQIIKGHALLDGNKRVGITSALVFLRINNFEINVPKGALLEMALNVATDKVDRTQFTKWLEENSVKLK